MVSMRLFPLVVLGFFSIGCANWLTRQECDKINWHDHAFQIAMSGKRLTGDPDIDRCRKAEFELPERELDLGFKAGMAKYCEPEIVYATGRNGDFFSPDLCDGGSLSALKRKHQAGVQQYCLPSNARAAGLSGKKYQNICPADLEKDFLPGYREGRRKYLESMISSGVQQERDLDGHSRQLERQKSGLATQLSFLPQVRIIKERVVTATGLIEQEKSDDPYAYERERLRREIDRLNSEIIALERQQENIRDARQRYQTELATLGD